jgi:hypothetical protein
VESKNLNIIITSSGGSPPKYDILFSVRLFRLACKFKKVNLTQFKFLQNLHELHHGMETRTSDLKQNLGFAMFDLLC